MSGLYKVHGAAPYHAHCLGTLVRAGSTIAVLSWHLNPKVFFTVEIRHLIPLNSI